MLDPSSPIFLRQDTVYVPTVFVSFYGDALDEKTPLLRAMDAVSTEVRKRQGCTRVTLARRSHTWRSNVLARSRLLFSPRASRALLREGPEVN